MWMWFRRLITSPVFSADEEKTRTAQILNAIIWFNILVWMLALFGMPFTAQPMIGASIMGSMLLIAIGALAALHAGYVRAVSWGFVLFLWSSTTILVAISGGIVNPETAGFLIVLLAAGMLSGIGATLIWGVLSIIASLTITWLGMQGMLPVWLPILPFVGFLIAFVNIALTTGLIGVTISGWRQAMKRAHQYARELELERSSLAQHVLERTQSLETARREAETAREQAESARVALEAQVWQTTGLVRISEAIRGEQDLTTFCQNALQALCQHLQIPVGAMYLVETDQLVFRGGYAFIPEDASAHFAIGEGLLGQAALDRKPILIEDVPPAYLTILSGLGGGLPNQIMLWPILYNQRLTGVLELGLLTTMPSEYKQFLEHASETMATALQTAQARQRVDELLAKTQAQAEELRMREEELRAINEELLAQTEQLEARR